MPTTYNSVFSLSLQQTTGRLITPVFVFFRLALEILLSFLYFCIFFLLYLYISAAYSLALYNFLFARESILHAICVYIVPFL